MTRAALLAAKAPKHSFGRTATNSDMEAAAAACPPAVQVCQNYMKNPKGCRFGNECRHFHYTPKKACMQHAVCRRATALAADDDINLPGPCRMRVPAACARGMHAWTSTWAASWPHGRGHHGQAGGEGVG